MSIHLYKHTLDEYNRLYLNNERYCNTAKFDSNPVLYKLTFNLNTEIMQLLILPLKVTNKEILLEIFWKYFIKVDLFLIYSF